MKLHFRARVITGFVITLLIIGALGIYAFWSTQRLIDTAQLLTHANRVVNSAEQLFLITTELESSQRGFIITGDSLYLEPYDSAIKNVDRHIASLIELTSVDEQQHRRAQHLDTLIRKRIAIARDVLLKRGESFEEARNLMLGGEGKQLMDQVRVSVREIQDFERAFFRSRNRVTAQSLVQFQTAFVGLLIIPALIVTILFFSIIRHFSARNKAELEARRASGEANELNKELESYTYSVSHDLRAPLRSIDGYSQILKEDYNEKLDDEGKRVIGVIINNARRMGKLIDDLLDFSRIGRKELQMSELSVDELVSSVIEELVEQKHAKNVSIKVHPLGKARGDFSMLKQAWVNLISNAIKYSGRREDPSIEIGSYRDNSLVCYYVKDNGVGFNMNYKDKLFGVFQRLHKADEFEGTGVGLALTKRIINRHGGDIWAESKLNEGATFYFSLPSDNHGHQRN